MCPTSGAGVSSLVTKPYDTHTFDVQAVSPAVAPVVASSRAITGGTPGSFDTAPRAASSTACPRHRDEHVRPQEMNAPALRGVDGPRKSQAFGTSAISGSTSSRWPG